MSLARTTLQEPLHGRVIQLVFSSNEKIVRLILDQEREIVFSSASPINV